LVRIAGRERHTSIQNTADDEPFSPVFLKAARNTTGTIPQSNP
jgi:hypothetical protein